MKGEGECVYIHTHTRIIPAFLYLIGLGWTVWLLIILLMLWESPILLVEYNRVILLVEILSLTSIVIAYLVYLPTITNPSTVTPVRVCKDEGACGHACMCS